MSENSYEEKDIIIIIEMAKQIEELKYQNMLLRKKLMGNHIDEEVQP